MVKEIAIHIELNINEAYKLFNKLLLFNHHKPYSFLGFAI